MQADFFLFLTFRPNNVFFVLHRQNYTIDKDGSLAYTADKMLVSTSCGLFKEKGIKRHTDVAFESNFKYFLQKIKLKKVFFDKLNVVVNTSLPKNHREKLHSTFSIKKYLKIILKYLLREKVRIALINNQRIAFNGCRLPKLQRKKMRKHNLNWFKLFTK